MNIKLLDCTLRDGGYINNWNWGFDCARTIIRTLAESGTDIVEVGFLRDIESFNPNVTVANSIDDLNRFVCAEKSNVVFSAMAMQSNYTHKKLSPYSGKGINLIRTTFHNYDIKEGLEFAKEIKEKGYMLAVNPINIMGYSDSEILKLIEKINLVAPDYFSIVDTFGSMTLEDLERIAGLVDHNLDQNIGIGLHLHENLSMSFSLAQSFLSRPFPRNIVVDGSLVGMGRTPGNLPIELLANHLNTHFSKKYDIDGLLDAAQAYILPLKGEANWGYSPAYFLSAKYNLHRNYAEHFLQKGDLTIKDINQLLSRIESGKSAAFDARYADGLYENYKCKNYDDVNSRNKLKNILEGKNILILAPGKNLATYKQKILNYITKEKPFVIALNFAADEFNPDCQFFSNNNRYRYFRNPEKPMVLTSNITVDTDGSSTMIIDYKSISQPLPGGCNSLLLLLKLLFELGFSKVFVAGADGYKKERENYFNSSLATNTDRDENFNADVKKAINVLGIKVDFITPSLYEKGNVPLKKQKAILFDLDGTLLDTTKGVVEAVKITLSELGMEIPPYEILKQFVGPVMQDSFEKHFGFEKEKALECANLFRANYKKHSLFLAEPYSGILDFLAFLKDSGYKLAVATNKSHENAMLILEKFGIAKYLDCAVGCDLEGRLSKADIILKCLKELAVEKYEAVLIGDSTADSDGAQKAGVDFMAVTYGFGFKSKDDLKDVPNVGVFETIGELKDLFKKNTLRIDGGGVLNTSVFTPRFSRVFGARRAA